MRKAVEQRCELLGAPDVRSNVACALNERTNDLRCNFVLRLVCAKPTEPRRSVGKAENEQNRKVLERDRRVVIEQLERNRHSAICKRQTCFA